MHDDRSLVEQRLDRVLTERLRPAIYSHRVPLTVRAWTAPGEPVPFARARTADYEPVRSGDPWGPPWSTVWFHLTGEVPADWAGRRVEAVVDLGFEADRAGFQCEGLAYTPDGVPVKGLNPRNAWLPVAASARGGERVEYLVEAGANPLIGQPSGPTTLGERETAGSEPLYRLGRLDLAVLETEVWELVQDLEVLNGLMRELGLRDPRRFELVRALERALDAIDLHDVAGTAAAARKQLTEVLSRPANASAPRITATGHAHIDSAWLWPLRETMRKVARTTANVTALMAEHPDFTFAMSQAQQLAWLKSQQPALFAKVAERVATGQFVPVGGMWVESDTNLPGGEALARQFVHGKRFFLEEFGLETREVWLPDSFGYSAALPQLVRLSGSRWFLTQKISWNQVNRFPHHTFAWEGIDGTRVFTHFPPVDTYNSDLSGKELAHAAGNFAEKGHATRFLVPFGWGNGGGGPTREMIARAHRTADLEGSPRVGLGTPRQFFEAAEAEYPEPPVWVGELYLELHRGTYTSQARTKQGNRRSEHLLREAELWCATAAVAGLADYPYEALDRLWKTVLLHQFHDILPGSSIAWVHREAEATYAEIRAELEELIAGALRALAGEGDATVVFNAAPHATADGTPALGAAVATARPDPVPVRLTGTADGGHLLDNGLVRLTVDARGLVTSLVDLAADREVIPAGAAGNLLQLHADLPNAWDAWDIDSFYRNRHTDLTGVERLTAEVDAAGVATVSVVRHFGASRVTQRTSLRPGTGLVEFDTEVDWHEVEAILKVALPADVHTDRCACEIQFGHVYRPTHGNTSWDAAKFEIPAHRFVHVAEPGYGVAVVNDSTYGHDVTRATGVDGVATSTVVRLSLLRAPRYPDPRTDQGLHRFRYALVAGAAIGDAVREGYQLNLPPRRVPGGTGVAPLVTVDNPAVVVEAVKLADDRSGDLVVRLYESLGGRAAARLRTRFPATGAYHADLLERPLADAEPVTLDGADDGGSVALRLRPFQIVTLRLRR
ncbi:glycoside hydrolase family 38 C-terminal domain-containing protein [Micromonospora sp. NPDC049559]|uniref:alpha-mannosidase n=1 Tax=Micromonospora sp. NPDC049559 TaxID=3155923 RepID=UPI00342232C7